MAASLIVPLKMGGTAMGVTRLIQIAALKNVAMECSSISHTFNAMMETSTTTTGALPLALWKKASTVGKQQQHL